jgi:hypothetical protein
LFHALFSHLFVTFAIRSVVLVQDVRMETVSNWERGKAIPKLTVPQFKTLLKVLKVAVDQLPDDFGPLPEQP